MKKRKPTWAEYVGHYISPSETEISVCVKHDTPRDQPPVTVVTIHDDTHYGARTFIGIARCSAQDQFSRRRGREIAFQRAFKTFKIVEAKEDERAKKHAAELLAASQKKIDQQADAFALKFEKPS